jgi:hypothetical protein
MSARFTPALFCLLAGTARASDWYVDQSFASCSQSDGSLAKPYCTIGGAVAVAAGGDTIHIAPGTYFELVTATIDLNFVGTQGAATTIIDGANTSITMVVNSGASVTVTGLTFHASYKPPPYVGAAIQGGHASVALTDCVFDSNRGGVAVEYCALTVDRCAFTGNVNSGAGGAINTAFGTVAIRDSLFEKNVGSGGAVVITHATQATLDRCVFHANEASGMYYGGGIGGGLAGEDVAVTDCLFDSNTIPIFGYGGGAAISGTSTLTRCRFVANSVTSSNGSAVSAGGGLWILEGTTSLIDCEIVGNICTTGTNGVGGHGGGVLVGGSFAATADFLRCTIAGNRADGPGTVTYGGAGGGVYVDTYKVNTVTLEETIVADNFAADTTRGPDVDGAATTNDWNVIGNTFGLTLTGSGPHDLLDVDPLLTDPANGDGSLQPTSPCIDSGDPASAPGGLDIAGVPRVLDGNLDRGMVLDRGAREFDNVLFTITGPATPGGSLTFDTNGTSGLALLMIVGVAENERTVRPFGGLFVDLAFPFLIVPWGTIPDSRQLSIPPTIPTPTTVMLQEIALSGPTGNFSNFVSLTIE